MLSSVCFWLIWLSKSLMAWLSSSVELNQNVLDIAVAGRHIVDGRAVLHVGAIAGGRIAVGGHGALHMGVVGLLQLFSLTVTSLTASSRTFSSTLAFVSLSTSSSRVG